jgi:hypothetical protein
MSSNKVDGFFCEKLRTNTTNRPHRSRFHIVLNFARGAPEIQIHILCTYSRKVWTGSVTVNALRRTSLVGGTLCDQKEVLFILKKCSEKSISFREPDHYEFLDEKPFDYLFKHINMFDAILHILKCLFGSLWAKLFRLPLKAIFQLLVFWMFRWGLIWSKKFNYFHFLIGPKSNINATTLQFYFLSTVGSIYIYNFCPCQ